MDVRILLMQQGACFWVPVEAAEAAVVVEATGMTIMAAVGVQGRQEVQGEGLSIFTQIRLQTAGP